MDARSVEHQPEDLLQRACKVATAVKAPAARVEVMRRLLYLVGISLAGFGIAGLLKARLGTDPFDAINAALAAELHLPVGTISWMDSVLILGGAWALGRRPKVGTILLAVLMGLVIDVAMISIPVPQAMVWRGLLAVLSLALLYLGITGFVLSDLGAGCLEELMLALVARGGRIHLVRWGIEAVLLAIALLLSGPISVMTVVFVLLTGPVLAGAIPLVARVCRVPVPHHDPGVPLGDIR